MRVVSRIGGWSYSVGLVGGQWWTNGWGCMELQHTGLALIQ